MVDLPDYFDVIVAGTGMPESILAAACTRAGKSVFHLDRNPYYGGDWASFTFDRLLEWIDKQEDINNDQSEAMIEASWLEQLNSNERLVLCPKNKSTVTRAIHKAYISERQIQKSEPIANDVTPDNAAGDIASSSGEHRLPVTESVSTQESQSDSSQYTEQEASASNEEFHAQGPASSSADSSVAVEPGVNDEAPSEVEEISPNNSAEPVEPSEDMVSTSGQVNRPNVIKKIWTLEMLKEDRRHFNVDLSPKVLYARGPLLELLISSNVSRYNEFRCISCVLTHIDGHLEQVPCSRADVFTTKSVSIVEKRMLMKLLTFCMDFQNHPEEYRGFEDKPFIEFLQSRKVTPNIEHYVLHAIAMVEGSCPTLQALEATQRFMQSLGRYGNSPFLIPCYGCGELPQSFCRLCAIFEGWYYLGRDIDAIILDSNDCCVGIISQGRKIKCQKLIMEHSYSPLEYLPDRTPDMVSRAIYITDSPILPSERLQNTLLRLQPIDGVRSAIMVLEFNSMAFVCPEGLYLVHMTCSAYNESVEMDFKSAEEELFQSMELDESEEGEKLPENEKPKVLWCTYFRIQDTLSDTSRSPTGLFLTSSPGTELDYDRAVHEAKEIFDKCYPGEEFLPRAPDPEDIVRECHSNPGDEPNEDNDYTEPSVKSDSNSNENVTSEPRSEKEPLLPTVDEVAGSTQESSH